MFVRYIFIILLITLSGCSQEYNYSLMPNIVESVQDLEQPNKIDLLLAIDNSCSMDQDWDYISYGLIQLTEDLNESLFKWKLAIISMDPMDGIFIDVPYSKQSDGWDMIDAIDQLKTNGGSAEKGFKSALNAFSENRSWFREDIVSLIVFVSDEPEQSNLNDIDFHDSWNKPHMVISIVGPETDTADSCAEAAPKYHNASQFTIDVCTTEPWSIVDKIN